eukprot:3760905-Pleurochrysis_carterae.AAC.4
MGDGLCLVEGKRAGRGGELSSKAGSRCKFSKAVAKPARGCIAIDLGGRAAGMQSGGRCWDGSAGMQSGMWVGINVCLIYHIPRDVRSSQVDTRARASPPKAPALSEGGCVRGVVASRDGASRGAAEPRRDGGDAQIERASADAAGRHAALHRAHWARARHTAQ